MVPHKLAQVQKVLLVGLFFPACGTLPLADKILRSERHCNESLGLILQENDLPVGTFSFQFGTQSLYVPRTCLIQDRQGGEPGVRSGVTDLQVEVLYRSTQYYSVPGPAAALCPNPDLVAHDNRNIWIRTFTVHSPIYKKEIC